METMIMNNYKEKFEKHMLGVFSAPDIWLEKGSGVKVYDVEGKEYLDFLGGIAVCATGHCHPTVSSAICEQASKLIHCTNLYGIPGEVELARELCSLTKLDKAFFSNSGAEANEAAIKIARKYAHTIDPDKSNIVTADNSFHGRTLVTVTATGQEKYQKGYHPLPSGFIYTTYNNIEALKDAIGRDTAAVMLEPIQGEGGIIPGNESYMKAARDLCDDNDALLILDEIQSGMGRTGMFLASENFGVKGDIVTLAKALGSGFPIGATLCNEKCASVMGPGDHGSTFGGNPLACSAALATLDVIRKEDLIMNAAKMGTYIKGGINDLESFMVREVRGMGLLIGIELNEPKAVEMKNWCAEKGLLVGSIKDNIIRLAPPLMITKSDADFALGVLKGYLK